MVDLVAEQQELDSMNRALFAKFMQETPEVFYYTSDLAELPRNLRTAVMASGFPEFLKTIPDGQTFVCDLTGLSIASGPTDTNWTVQVSVERGYDAVQNPNEQYSDLEPEILRGRLSQDVNVLSEPTLFVSMRTGESMMRDEERTVGEAVTTLLCGGVYAAKMKEFIYEFVSKAVEDLGYTRVKVHVYRTK